MDAKEFNRLKAEGYTHIPIIRPVDLGAHSPVDIFARYSQERDCYLLESLTSYQAQERYSFIGLPCQERIEVYDNCIRHFRDNQLQHQRHSSDPMEYLHRLHRRFIVPDLPDLPRLNGGLVGFFAYDCARYFEPRLNQPPRPPSALEGGKNTPDIVLLVSMAIIICDHRSRNNRLVVIASTAGEDAYQRACGQTDRVADGLKRRMPQPVPAAPAPATTDDESLWSSVRSNLSSEEHADKVKRIQRYIYDGDVMQVVLSRSLSVPFEGDPLEIYRQMRVLNPSPYMYYFNFGDYQITGSSPETLVRIQQGEVNLRPLAGTRRRGASPEQDEQLAKELLADEKERAEHLMLIDLGRNDLGRVCRTGTVITTEKMKIEYYSHVIHIVSNIVGKLTAEATVFDALKATFPAGTLTGAPKIRAMEIIAELEPNTRGYYGGAIGYIAWNNSMNLAITIRTALVYANRLYFQAGGGIVGDSVAKDEWVETINKAKVIVQATASARARSIT